jgi:ubiquinone/menaquinone biosynthesis C-methylase UbiE
MADQKEKQNTLEKCRRLWESLYPEVRKPETHLREWYRDSAAGGGAVLDVGCGAGGAIECAKDIPGAVTVGIDPDFESLKRNGNVRFRVAASADALPFRDGVFSTVTAQYVLEHLPNPEKSFSEIARVSRPGGSFAFMTTNAASYTGLAIRMIPASLQRWIKKKALKMDESEIYPVYMRCNTRGRLARLLRDAGFGAPDLVFIGGPFYFAFSFAVFRLAVLLERITDGRLRQLKFYIVGRSRKK